MFAALFDGKLPLDPGIASPGASGSNDVAEVYGSTEVFAELLTAFGGPGTDDSAEPGSARVAAEEGFGEEEEIDVLSCGSAGEGLDDLEGGYGAGRRGRGRGRAETDVVLWNSHRGLFVVCLTGNILTWMRTRDENVQRRIVNRGRMLEWVRRYESMLVQQGGQNPGFEC